MILTGTPAGVGPLQAGDVVEVEIEGVGVLAMQWREELTRRFPALKQLSSDCYVVGGAIRDLLLGRDPADADVACIDPLAAAKSVRNRVIRLGGEEHLSA